MTGEAVYPEVNRAARRRATKSADTPATTSTTIHTVAIEMPPPAPVKAVPDPFDPDVASTLGVGLSGYPAAARAEGAVSRANATAHARALNIRFMVWGVTSLVGQGTC
jgi:hypothetical protein